MSKFNMKNYRIPDELLPESKYLIRLGEKYGCLTVTSNPIWLELICGNRLIQHANCQCECGKISFRTATRIKHEFINCKHQPKKVPATGKRHKGTFLKDGVKRCSSCLKFLNEESYSNNDRRPDNKSSRCKNCSYVSSVKGRYNLDITNIVNTNDNFNCEICNKVLFLPNDTKNKYEQINVDHNHTTGEYRGILCVYCNCALGFIKEDENILQNMIKYIDIKEPK